MKKYKSIAKAVLLSCTLALTTSCNDFLDKAPDDQLTMEMIFTDNMGPLLLGRITQAHTFRPYLLARGKSTSGKRPEGILCQPDEVRSPFPDSLLLLFDD